MQTASVQYTEELILKVTANIPWIDVKKCRYRKSGTGNIVVSDKTKDIFVIRKDGSVVDLSGKLGSEIKVTPLAELMPKEEADGAWLMTKNVIAQLQGELNSNDKWYGGCVIEKYRVYEKDAHTMEVLPLAGSKYINMVAPLTIQIPKGIALGKLIISARETVRSTKHKAYLSEYAKEMIGSALKEKYQDDKSFLIPPEFLPYMKSKEFFSFILEPDANYLPNTCIMGECGILEMDFLGEKLILNTKTDEIRFASEDTLRRTAYFCRTNKRGLNRIIRVALENSPSSITINSVSVMGNVTVMGKKVPFRQRHEEISASRLLSDISSAKKDLQLVQMEDEQEFYDKIHESDLYGNAVASAVADCVIKNAGKITANMVIKHLRGLKESGLASDSFYKGKFRLIPDASIKEVILQMIDEGLLIAGNGKNGNYQACHLKPAPYLDLFLRYDVKPSGGNYEAYTDFDWLMALNGNGKLSDKKPELLLPVLDHPSVFCLEKEKTADFIRKMPSEWMDYIETIRAVETGTAKEYWRELKKAVVEKR